MLEQTARQAIRVYAQICNMDPVPSAATFQIGMIHRRLGNNDDALKCFDTVIDIDPDGRHGIQTCMIYPLYIHDDSYFYYFIFIIERNGKKIRIYVCCCF